MRMLLLALARSLLLEILHVLVVVLDFVGLPIGGDVRLRLRRELLVPVALALLLLLELLLLDLLELLWAPILVLFDPPYRSSAEGAGEGGVRQRMTGDPKWRLAEDGSHCVEV
jgi:hypothetical protein